MIDDNIISNLFFGNRQLKSSIYKKYKDNYNSEIYKYIINRFKDSKSFEESLYRIKFKVYIRPVCEECGKELQFFKGNGKYIFNRFCSRKCANNNELSKQRLKETCLKKYGTNNVAKSTYFKDTYIKHIQEKYNDYTITNAWQAKEVKEKIKKTMLNHYGVTNYGKLLEHQRKLNSQQVIEKRELTKKKNGTLNTSKPELESYNLLKQVYPDTIHHYKDNNRYPFNCDFYIPSLDLYIECQYGQFHHHRPFLGTEEDLKDIEILKENAKRIHQEKNVFISRYDVEIETWTIRDVKKRNIAKENKLNYIEFWNIKELQDWLNK